MRNHRHQQKGFTFVELIIVVVILGILSAVLIPRYWEVARQARIASLEGVVGAMRSAVAITRTKALSQGLSPGTSNPGGGNAQNIFLVEVDGLEVEVDWANLCPESDPELGDASSDGSLSMLDYLLIEDTPWSDTNQFIDGQLNTHFNNQFTWLGYDIRLSGPGGCYVVYDSFGDRDFSDGNSMCTITLVTDDC